MFHEPVSETKQDKAAPFKAKLGLWMFALYAVIYFGFIVINLVEPSFMERSFLGTNVAIVYGMGLIVLAIILALIYNVLSSRKENELNSSDEKEEAA